MIGCRNGLEMWSDPSLPVCTSMEQMMKHQRMMRKIFTMELKMVRKTTSCNPPCHYNEYQVTGDPVTLSTKILSKSEDEPDHQALLLSFSSTDVETRTESLIYKPLNFVAELGGALGLFLGVSFMTVWDIIMIIIVFFKKK